MPEPGQEIVPTPLTGEVVVNPATGESIDLNAPTDVIAGALHEVRLLEGSLRDYKSALNREILRRMDHARTWTAHLRGFGKVSAPAPPTPEYDGKILRSRLQALVPGHLSQEAVDAAVELVMEHKVRKVGVNALLKIPDEEIEAALIAAALAPKSRSVSISRVKASES